MSCRATDAPRYRTGVGPEDVQLDQEDEVYGEPLRKDRVRGGRRPGIKESPALFGRITKDFHLRSNTDELGTRGRDDAGSGIEDGEATRPGDGQSRGIGGAKAAPEGARQTVRQLCAVIAARGAQVPRALRGRVARHTEGGWVGLSSSPTQVSSPRMFPKPC